MISAEQSEMLAILNGSPQYPADRRYRYRPRPVAVTRGAPAEPGDHVVDHPGHHGRPLRARDNRPSGPSSISIARPWPSERSSFTGSTGGAGAARTTTIGRTRPGTFRVLLQEARRAR